VALNTDLLSARPATNCPSYGSAQYYDDSLMELEIYVLMQADIPKPKYQVGALVDCKDQCRTSGTIPLCFEPHIICMEYSETRHERRIEDEEISRKFVSVIK
jgi:hypothetical protein